MQTVFAAKPSAPGSMNIWGKHLFFKMWNDMVGRGGPFVEAFFMIFEIWSLSHSAIFVPIFTNGIKNFLTCHINLKIVGLKRIINYTFVCYCSSNLRIENIILFFSLQLLGKYTKGAQTTTIGFHNYSILGDSLI